MLSQKEKPSLALVLIIVVLVVDDQMVI
ncbi:uncharacterized protein METZ01_LOCUS112839 [marine metagenome]|uniref:Uncharacterized protein n=1 Tax=marine metagenome TaxID=408172 RepID=A0A381X5F6_9ZZZZ